jgi:succinate dehydrogenase/fumarate reductase flavoprotein subunit
MTSTWHELMENDGRVPEWPYPIMYEQEREVETDVLVIGGGIAGCWAALSAARTKGVRVALVEKAATLRSGAGGPGGDHWDYPMTCPLATVDPFVQCQRIIDSQGGYSNGIGHAIECQEGYDAFQELEKMGAKMRDVNDELAGAPGRDSKTKIVVAARYRPEEGISLRFWGTTVKPALKKECERLGVQIYDRIAGTSLLNEKGIHGARAAGATGVNTRTGEFMIFKAKAVILATAGIGSVWVFNTELAGISTFRSRNASGDGTVMAYRAGAEITLMEKSGLLYLGTGYKHKIDSGGNDPVFENVPSVDDNGKPLKASMAAREAVLKGELALPFWGDFPAMSEGWRKINWDLGYGEESTAIAMRRCFEDAGYDPAKDLMMNHTLIEGSAPAHFRSPDSMNDRGGLVVDWDLRTTLEGLYAAGEQMFAPAAHGYAAATGRYAGRKAAAYASQASRPAISRDQIVHEKARVYAPIKRREGIEWKELHAGIARMMQYFCSEYKTEKLLHMGLDALNEIEKDFVPNLYALDPHKLLRSLEDLNILSFSQLIVQGSLARKASSRHLNFQRNKFITLKLVDGKIKTGEMPHAYWGDLKKNYENHNRDYKGV